VVCTIRAAVQPVRAVAVRQQGLPQADVAGQQPQRNQDFEPVVRIEQCHKEQQFQRADAQHQGADRQQDFPSVLFETVCLLRHFLVLSDCLSGRLKKLFCGFSDGLCA
jgi:hypothetical protein